MEIVKPTGRDDGFCNKNLRQQQKKRDGDANKRHKDQEQWERSKSI